MSRRARPWSCRACGASNAVGTRRCSACLTPRPKRRTAANKFPVHPYEFYVELNGTENCFICGKPPGKKKNHRDHDHKTGMPRGILCFVHNSILRRSMTIEVAKKYVLYLERAARIAEQLTNQPVSEEQN